MFDRLLLKIKEHYEEKFHVTRRLCGFGRSAYWLAIALVVTVG